MNILKRIFVWTSQSKFRPEKLELNSEIPHSRFYIRRNIIIGNSAKCIIKSTEEEEFLGGKPATHKFKLYIRDVNFRQLNLKDKNSRTALHYGMYHFIFIFMQRV